MLPNQHSYAETNTRPVDGANRMRCPQCGDMLCESGGGYHKCRRCQFSLCVSCEGAYEDGHWGQ